MSRRTTPPPARRIASAIYREEGRFRKASERLAARMGPVLRVSEPFPFDGTAYYEPEMGAPLFRRFLVFRGTAPRDSLVEAKLAAEAVERATAVDGRRTVNLDPGLVTEENLVLATGKNYTHRVYLGDGVFADLALVYGNGEYRPLPWTYPDYASEEVRAFLKGVREELRSERKKKEALPCGGA